MRLQSFKSANAGAEETRTEIVAAGSASAVRRAYQRICARKLRLIFGAGSFARVTCRSASLVDQRAGALIGEQFEQDRVPHLAVDDHDALYALLQRIDAGLDFRDHAARNGAVGDQFARILD